MMNCRIHGEWDNRSISGCPSCVALLRKVVEAAHEELEFTYSHPNAAARGEVWVDRKKCPKLYKAMQEYWKAMSWAPRRTRRPRKGS